MFTEERNDMVSAEAAKRLLSKHGKTRMQSATDWKGKIPLPLALERFYLEVGPSNVIIESYGNPYFLPSLAGLWKFQAGYRWNGIDNSPIDDWKDEWLVVADESGDPFIFDGITNKVSHANHGEGEWAAHEMFQDLNSMAACLSQIGTLIKAAGNEFMDENHSIAPAFRITLVEHLQTILGSKDNSEEVLDSLGFGE